MKKAKDSNRYSAGAKLKRASRDVAMILTTILGFYTTTSCAGFLLGRARSPNWSDSQRLTTFVHQRHSVRHVAPASQTVLPFLATIGGSPAIVELSIRAGDRKYVYRSDTDEVRSDLLPPDERAGVRRPILSSDADRGMLLTTATTTVSAATAALAKAGSLLARLKGKYGRAIAVGVAIVGCGAAFGYILGYKGEPDYGSANFQSALMNADPWRAAAKQYLSPAVRPADAPDASPYR